MARNTSAAFKEMFEEEVHQIYQEMGSKLMGAVRMKSDVKGEAVNFPVAGKGAAQARGGAGTLVETMNAGATQVRVLLEKFVAADYVDIYDLERLAFDDRQVTAETIAMAVGRRNDQFVLDALDAATPVATIADNIEDGSTSVGLTVTKLRRAKRELDDNGVPSMDRYLVCTPQAIESLLGQTEVTSTDFNTVQALAMGNIDSFLGFTFIMINDENIANTNATTVRTGLAGGGTVNRKYFAYHKKAIGLAMTSLMGNITMDFIPERTSWLIQANILANAVAIDPTGIVEINALEVV